MPTSHAPLELRDRACPLTVTLVPSGPARRRVLHLPLLCPDISRPGDPATVALDALASAALCATCAAPLADVSAALDHPDGEPVAMVVQSLLYTNEAWADWARWARIGTDIALALIDPSASALVTAHRRGEYVCWATAGPRTLADALHRLADHERDVLAASPLAGDVTDALAANHVLGGLCDAIVAAGQHSPINYLAGPARTTWQAMPYVLDAVAAWCANHRDLTSGQLTLAGTVAGWTLVRPGDRAAASATEALDAVVAVCTDVDDPGSVAGCVGAVAAPGMVPGEQVALAASVAC